MIDDQITVLIPTSPIPYHPSTHIIDQAIESVRMHLPEAHIIIMVDGVRPEQQKFWPEYRRYILRLCNPQGKENTSIFLAREFLHQAAMTRTVIAGVQTPLILFVEHDTFFLPGNPIDFDGIARVIQSGELNVVNFHCQWEPWVIPEHEYLMLDHERFYIDGVPFVRTWMWSQRPHVASTDFYRSILNSHFSRDCRTMIEDAMIQVITADRVTNGETAWDHWKLAYYAPEGSIRRTWTSDGRAGEPKFDMKF